MDWRGNILDEAHVFLLSSHVAILPQAGTVLTYLSLRHSSLCVEGTACVPVQADGREGWRQIRRQKKRGPFPIFQYIIEKLTVSQNISKKF